MKKLYTFLAVSFLCLLLAACASVRGRTLAQPTVTDRTAAVIDIVSTERSKIDLPETSAVSTQPKYFEVVATAATAETTKKRPVVVEEPKEYFTVKFVDIDGYTAISVQTVVEGGSATAPPMPDERGDLIFRGWDKDFSDVRSGMIVKAIYQKEWLTVRFFDADATLLKTQKVRYGATATPPEVKDKGNFLFDGWNVLFSDVKQDLDVYAIYYAVPERAYTTLPNAYSLLAVEENSLGIPKTAYYRKTHNNIISIGKNEYSGNILYGNFCDTLPIAGYGFTEFSGMLGLKNDAGNDGHVYSLRLVISINGEEVYSTEISGAGTYRTFSIDLQNAETLTVYLEPLIDGAIYYGDVSFVGGLIDAVLYED